MFDKWQHYEKTLTQAAKSLQQGLVPLSVAADFVWDSSYAGIKPRTDKRIQAKIEGDLMQQVKLWKK